MGIDSVKSVTAGLEEARKGLVDHTWAPYLASELQGIWNPQPLVEEEGVRYSIAAAPHLEDEALVPKRASALPKRPPPWFIGMSSAFSKNITKIDRSIQGRILDALVKISESPTEVVGDTIQPLTGNLKGCWRYRIAGFRIIYSPDKATGNITLLAFESRGSAYAD